MVKYSRRNGTGVSVVGDVCAWQSLTRDSQCCHILQLEELKQGGEESTWQEGIGYTYLIEKESQKLCDRSKENTECPAETTAGAFIFFFCCNRESRELESSAFPTINLPQVTCCHKKALPVAHYSSERE